MRISKLMAVGAAGCALAAAVTLPATAGTAAHHPAVASKTKQFPSTLTPKSVKPGQTLTLKGHGALKSTTYNCLLIVIKGANYYPDTASIVFPKSTKSGKITCHIKYKPFSGKPLSGPVRHCPLTKKDKKAGFKCAVAVSTTNMKSASRDFFTAKK
jgi:hypothetical protein